MSADAGTPPVESLTGAVLQFLRRHPPFDEMEEDALRFLAGRLRLGYFARGARILGPEHGEPPFLYIIRNGVVQLAPAEARDLPSAVDSTLGPGECFSVGALLERRPTSAAYVASEDVFCYQLPAPEFAALLQRSPRFQEFSTRYLASLLRESRRLLNMHHASLATEQQALGRALRAIVRRPPVSCAPDTTIGAALRSMQEARVGSIVVTAPDGAPAGIFTRYDVLERVALAGRDLAQPIATVMTAAPRTLPAEASAHDAALLIAQHGIRHVPVMEGPRLIGVVTERDLFALQRVGIRSIHGALARASRPQDLPQAAADIRALARSLMGEGVGAEPLMLIVSALNDALTARVIELESPRHALDGLSWGWLAFGSEGRREQTISTDQDNGIVFATRPGESAGSARERLLPLARAVNATLEACGYPRCVGGIMAGNEKWCLSLDEWIARFEGWIANTDPRALLAAAIFFDFRLLHGRDELLQALRERVSAAARSTPRFLRDMADAALQARPPLGIMGDFVTEEVDGGAPAIDLKKSGARLFVDAARIFALGAGAGATSTADRLRQAGTRLGVPAEETASEVEAFLFIQLLRLRAQGAAQGMPVVNHNLVRPRQLNEVDRRTLKECLRQARRLQRRLALDYSL